MSGVFLTVAPAPQILAQSTLFSPEREEDRIAARPTLGFYGTTGLIDMPTASSAPDGQLSLGTSYMAGIVRTALTFQINPRISGTFRYTFIEDYRPNNPNRRNYYDRSFDISYRFLDEGRYTPAMTVGLQDFGGTGLFAAEYVAATKSFGEPGNGQIRVTGGLGWGRFATRDSFRNPLGILDDRFETRPGREITINETGRFKTDRWFRGDAAFFGGIEWDASPRLTFKAEYSNDDYVEETERDIFDPAIPISLGAAYKMGREFELGAYYLHGREFGVTGAVVLNPLKPAVRGGRESAPPPVFVRPPISDNPAVWAPEWAGLDLDRKVIRERVDELLDEQGLTMEALELTSRQAVLWLNNSKYRTETQAVGRAARVLSRSIPASAETFVIITTERGLPISRVVLKRSDLEELEVAPDGIWQSYVRARVEDAADNRMAPEDRQADRFPRWGARIRPYLVASYFDPDAPIRLDFGAELNGTYTPAPGVVFSGRVRKRLAGNIDDGNRRKSNSEIERVRSNAVLYDQQGDPSLTYLTGEYFFRPGPDLYGRVTAGYLERMYGGLSTEVLWKPVDSRLALGLEMNYVKQREFEVGFGFQDYEVATGHASAYWDLQNGFQARVDAGRYLGGDWGATFALDREFRNGVTVGAFFTLTDIPFDEFGEGSFDKGVRISLPIEWISGDSDQSTFGRAFRPVSRDGGARLSVRNRLYYMIDDKTDPKLQENWGRFWR